jgi:hypothetical protein
MSLSSQHARPLSSRQMSSCMDQLSYTSPRGVAAASSFAAQASMPGALASSARSPAVDVPAAACSPGHARSRADQAPVVGSPNPLDCEKPSEHCEKPSEQAHIPAAEAARLPPRGTPLAGLCIDKAGQATRSCSGGERQAFEEEHNSSLCARGATSLAREILAALAGGAHASETATGLIELVPETTR